LEPRVSSFDQHFPPIFRTPDDMIVTIVGHIVVRTYALIHTSILQHEATECHARFPPVPKPHKKERPFIPIDESRGIAGGKANNCTIRRFSRSTRMVP